MKFTGIVQKGMRRGTALGYPTANIACDSKDIAGVYAARVYIGDEAPYRAAAFGDPSRGVLEAHLLDFSDDIYGMEISVELFKKLRESAAYESDEVLKRQIGQDVKAVREYFDHV